MDIHGCQLPQVTIQKHTHTCHELESLSGLLWPRPPCTILSSHPTFHPYTDTHWPSQPCFKAQHVFFTIIKKNEILNSIKRCLYWKTENSTGIQHVGGQCSHSALKVHTLLQWLIITYAFYGPNSLTLVSSPFPLCFSLLFKKTQEREGIYFAYDCPIVRKHIQVVISLAKMTSYTSLPTNS